MREFIIRTKNYLLIIFVIYLAYLFISNYLVKEAPKCGDQVTIDNVYSILNEDVQESKELIGMKKLNIKIKLNNIVTLDKNNNTGAYFCQADVLLTSDADGGEFKAIVTFNNRIIEDEKNQFLTTVTNFQKNN